MVYDEDSHTFVDKKLTMMGPAFIALIIVTVIALLVWYYSGQPPSTELVPGQSRVTEIAPMHFASTSSQAPKFITYTGTSVTEGTAGYDSVSEMLATDVLLNYPSDEGWVSIEHGCRPLPNSESCEPGRFDPGTTCKVVCGNGMVILLRFNLDRVLVQHGFVLELPR